MPSSKERTLIQMEMDIPELLKQGRNFGKSDPNRAGLFSKQTLKLYDKYIEMQKFVPQKKTQYLISYYDYVKGKRRYFLIETNDKGAIKYKNQKKYPYRDILTDNPNVLAKINALMVQEQSEKMIQVGFAETVEFSSIIQGAEAEQKANWIKHLKKINGMTKKGKK